MTDTPVAPHNATSPNQKKMREAMVAWERQNRAAAAQAATTDWSKVKVDPKDIAFRMGPIMSEEEFKAHCQRTGTRPTILKK